MKKLLFVSVVLLSLAGCNSQAKKPTQGQELQVSGNVVAMTNTTVDLSDTNNDLATTTFKLREGDHQKIKDKWLADVKVTITYDENYNITGVN